MSPETKNCQNCKKDFVIEAEDFNFYEKMKVPPPTFCPDCRFIRRMIWRNERSLYKRKCNMCKENIISIYDDKILFPVYCPECYKSDKWEAGEYAKDYNFSKPFFEQWKELFNFVPRPSISLYGQCINSEYANLIKDTKNVYLSYSILDSEGIYYSSNIDLSKEIIDSYNTVEGELLYENIGVTKNYDCKYSYWSSDCINCSFIFDCVNCQDCFSCVSLRNKRYCIENIQYSQDEYYKKIKSFNIGSYKSIKKIKSKFNNFLLKFPKKHLRMINCINSTGDEIRDCRNVHYLFKGHDNENIKFGYRITHARDSMDVCHSWAELAYEHASGGSENSKNIKFVINGNIANFDCEYIDYCKSSSDLFGCIGLKNKQFCILNKQYTKEQYEELIPKIKEQMNNTPYIDIKGRVYKYGEFFPIELCPFSYNETAINDHFLLNKEEVVRKGYPYKEKIENKYDITLKVEDIPDDVKDVKDLILNEVIECAQSGKAFKITFFELQFYRRMNIPIPRLHPDERYKERMKLKNPMKLWHRVCMKNGCQNEFETSYSPESREIVYCEKCYQQEVY